MKIIAICVSMFICCLIVSSNAGVFESTQLTITKVIARTDGLHIGLSPDPDPTNIPNNWRGTIALIEDEERTLVASLLSAWNSGKRVISDVHFTNIGTGDGSYGNWIRITTFSIVP